MWRFFLRLFVIMAAAIAATIVAVPALLEHTYSAEADAYYYDAVRGQFHTLVEQFNPLTPAERERHLAQLAPHYGLTLSLVDPRRLDVSASERAALDAGRFIVRSNQDEYVVPIPPAAHAPAQWLHVRLPHAPIVTVGTFVATILVVAAIFAGFLMIWVWPTWRDLETLKAAAQRMGAGDLRARANVSRRSNVRELAGRFNRMSERIGDLVERQRELTNAVSHELRTPIARLTFALDLLEREHDADARATLVGDMRDDLRELDELVAELLAYARLERSDEQQPPETVDAARWLGDALAAVALEAAAARVTCRVAAGVPATVTLHPRLMTRALVNLLRNAIRHATSTIEVTLARDAHGDALIVDDDGPGIAPAHRTRVFEPFTRLDESRDRATGGFGLGLAIVARIAQRHGGSVEISDAPLRGARIVIRWNGAA